MGVVMVCIMSVVYGCINGCGLTPAVNCTRKKYCTARNLRGRLFVSCPQKNALLKNVSGFDIMHSCIRSPG